jgi:energy-coupling factor transporter ATP-binding protein EcfA2
VNRLRFTYPGGSPFELFIDSMTIRRGEVLGLAGPNGCGKSTLGLLLCGLYEPAEGTIALSLNSGEQPLKAEERTRRIAYMFQNPDYQIFLPTVRDELAFGLEEAGMEKGEIDQRTAEAITLFGLPPGSAPPTLLSYGARKRLQAATYYLLERDLYILDEADAGLTYADMISIIGNLQKRGSAVMLITHDALLAADICHRVVLMEGGRITETLDSAAYRRRSLGDSR